MDLRAQLQETVGNSFRVERELGGGGMSRVFVAVDTSLGRKVVLKVLPPEMAAAVRIERFRREIQLAANLQHPHIVPLLSAGETNGLPYFMMPFVQGESLRERLQREGELPIRDAIRILREVASALAHAHHNGIVHRDIKPENVLLSGGSAVVTDFGVAKALASSALIEADTLTSVGMTLGTPAYMAPEQASADRMTDHRADVYALGVMGYEMISGSTPFVASSPQAMLAAHIAKKPEVLSERRENVPPPLVTLIMLCLAKKPADRVQSAEEVVRLLDQMNTSGSDLTSVKPSAPPSAHRPMVNLWKGAALGGLVLLLAVAATVWRKERRHPVDFPPEWTGVYAAVNQYAHAIGNRDVHELQNVFPAMPSEQVSAWNQFFATTPKVEAMLSVDRIEGSDSLVNVDVDGEYKYDVFRRGQKKSESHAVFFSATLQGRCPEPTRAPCGNRTTWKIASLRGLMVR